MFPPSMTNREIEGLREQYYNATLSHFHRLHDDLAILRVRPDARVPTFEAGQYVVLGLGYWEPRLPQAQREELAEEAYRRMAMRAYSICTALFDGTGVVRATEMQELEFYIARVMQGQKHAPALTPRLFAKQVGDRLFLGPKARGTYSLRHVGQDSQVAFFATGTGEAPHNAMIAELLHRGHQAKIVSVVCCRHDVDFGYLDVHRQLMDRYPNYRYLTLTTREPRNLDAAARDYVGVRYLQDYFQSGDLERDADIDLSPERTHVYLCGNPQMIGPPRHREALPRAAADRATMLDLLELRGFTVDRPRAPGNVHFESYW